MWYLLTSLRVQTKLILDHKLLVWQRLHGFWGTLSNFSPQAVSSEPGQDLEGEARVLLFPSRGGGNVSEEDEPENELEEGEIEDTSLLDMVGGAAGVMDMGTSGWEDLTTMTPARCEVMVITILTDFR